MPPDRPPLNRVLLKLSGEAFCAPGAFGIEPSELRLIASEIAAAAEHTQIAVVVGGGNFIRGAELTRTAGDDEPLIHRATADQMGMLGTVINGLALREALDSLGREARCITAMDIPAVAEPFIRLRAIRHMELGKVIILAGGTGNPFFTTDTAAALRATELECDAFLKATKVDGVYTADPAEDASATRHEALTFGEALRDRLAVMDMTALTMCEEQSLPVIVFNFKERGNIARVLAGEDVGTLVTRA